jgi:putative ABC transport system permease protein
MLSLALSMIRNHKAGLAGAFVAVLVGSAVVTACGVLIDSGIRGGFPPERYAAASVVVGAPQSLAVPGGDPEPYSERVPLPAGRAAQIARIPGAARAVGDVSVAVSLAAPGHGILGGAAARPILAHGWSSAVLGPFTISAGRAPRGPGEVVLDTALAARAGVRPGGTVEVLSGSVPARYRVVGTVAPPPGGLHRQSAVFFTDTQAGLVSGHPGQVGTVGVLAAPGVSAGELARRIAAAVPGVVTYTGAARASAEFLDIGQARTFLVQAAGSLGGSMAIVVMFVVASALGLSLQQRRRELALLRAIAATPRQIHRLIGTETMLVACAAAVIGVLPGFAVSFLLRQAFAHTGVIPAGFTFVADPIPAIVAVALCVAVARLAALIAARRPARLSPVTALGEAAAGPRALSRFRLAAGYLLIPVAIAAALVTPLIVPGQAGQASVAAAALALVIAVALLGPRWLSAVAGLSRPLLSRRRSPGGFLAAASMQASSRRLSSAATPLIMAVTLSAVEIFGAATMIAAAHQQARDGLTAQYVLTGAWPGLSPRIAAAARGVPGVSVVTPVARTQVVASYRFGGDPAAETFSAQGLAAAGLPATLDLKFTGGSLDALRGNAVALSATAASTIGAHVGQTVSLHLGDGTPIRPRVVAIYGNGLGFGDVTLPHATVAAHTSSHLDTAILVRTAPGASVPAAGAALRAALARYPGVMVSGRAAFTAAQAGELASQSGATFVLDAVLLGYIMVAVVNSLIMATAARAREFALLRLVGSTGRQVRAMMRREAIIIIATAVVVGALAALPPLIGMSRGMTGSPVPSVPPLACLAIVAAVAALGWGSIIIPARLAMRSRPAGMLSSRD